jgi:hypothetical protein
MKRCPKCSRTFPDENQKFCTIDGGLLRLDPPAFDPNMTMRATSKDLTPIPEAAAPSEAPTSVRLTPLDETIASFGSATFQESSTGPIGASTADDLKPPASGATTSAGLRMPSEVAPTSIDLRLPAGVAPTSAELTPPPAVSTPAPAVSTPANLPAPVAAPAAGTPIPPTPAKKKSILPLVIGGILLLLVVLGGGAAAAGYFLWLKPRMEANRRPEIVVRETNENANRSTAPANTNSSEAPNTNTNANTNGVTPKEPEPYVPTTGAVQFANSKATLDGKLLEHYVDFSFYYPKAWLKDPQAGVPGASNFARISDSKEEPAGEKMAISWFASNGTFEADMPIFRDRVKELSDQLGKSLPNYEQVSQGETTVNNLKAYEFRFKGVFKDTPKGDLPYWGRVVFLPTGTAGEKNGVSIIMLATSLASGVNGVDDVGVKGGLPLILESFRFGPSK